MIITKILISFIAALTYPPSSDPDTFIMDFVCNLEDDCEITIPHIEEDEPGWNCETMGNQICGEELIY